ncbi:hypothetical protein ACP4OV_005542 [Aristida adscensionis]
MPVDSWDAFVLSRAPAGPPLKALAEAEADHAEARPWVLLSSLPRVLDGQRDDLALHLVPSPRLTVLTVSHRILVVRTTSSSVPGGVPRPGYPFVAAVDPSGAALLLCSNYISEYDGDAGPHHRWRYLLCDAVSRTASELVDLGHPGSVGIVRAKATAANRDLLTVAALTPAVDRSKATLVYLSPASTGSKWAEEVLDCPLPNNATMRWGNDGAIALGGKLWWVDIAHGLLTCDPSARDKVLRYVQLPPGFALPRSRTTDGDAPLRLDHHRGVKVSAFKLRFLHIHQPGGLPTVEV